MNPARARAQLVALDRFEADQSLRNFIPLAWPTLEPTQPYVGGWAIDAIAEHLEAVTYGWINRLLINVPPGSMKSLLSSVLWPAWEWGPRNKPSLRYIATAFNDGPVKRDTRKMRDLVASPWYQERWPKVALVRAGETSFSNSRTGNREGIPFGSLTSQRGDRLICFPYETLVRTERGLLPIGKIVHEKMGVRVWSTDTHTGKTSLKPVVGWLENPASQLVEVGLSDGVRFRCTPCHRIWTKSGWRNAVDLGHSDCLPILSFADRQNGVFADVESSRQFSRGFFAGEDVESLFFGKFCGATEGSPSAVSAVTKVSAKIPPGQAVSDLLYGPSCDTVFLRQHLSRFLAACNFGNLLARQLGAGPVLVQGQPAVSAGVGHVLQSCTVAEIVETVVRRIAVEMSDFLPRSGWTAKRQHDALVYLQHVLSAVDSARVEARVSAGTRRTAEQNARFYGTLDTVFHDGVRASFRADAAHVTDAVETLVTDYRTPLFVRDGGHVDRTYCLTVADNHTFYVGEGNSVLVANCDDLHSTKTAESPVEREKTVRQFMEGAINRLNDQDRSTIIVIMQRLHEGDVAGEILSRDMGYVHLNLPMEFESDRRCETRIGFRDPRTEDGELLNPDRFPRHVVEQLKRDMGEYAWAGQYQQRPVPREGGMFKLQWFAGRIVRAAPAGTVWVRHWDLAASKNATAAYTAGVKLGRTPDGKFVVANVRRFREEGHEVRRIIKAVGEADRIEAPDTVQSLPQDGGQAGKVQKSDMATYLAGFPLAFLIEATLGDKERRAMPFAVQCEAGNVTLVGGENLDADWIKPYLDELCMFPGGKYKDQVDATSGAFAQLTLGPAQTVVGSY